ncbi:MAG: methyl-accepting chemotaxis protein [Spirochaetales bacterium]|nr:methyl-accepting chemotaxis protein [Spirochaetales bacterium]
MGKSEDHKNAISNNKNEFIIVGITFVLINTLFSIMTLFVSRYFIFIVLPCCIAGLFLFYLIHRKQQKVYNDLFQEYTHLNVNFSQTRDQDKKGPVYEEKYKDIITTFQSYKEIVQRIYTQIHEYIALKKTDLEKVMGNQKNLINTNDTIIKEIQNKSSTFFTENNIVKELIKNIAEKVDSEIGFSRNTLQRLKNLFNIITDIIKASEILYSNSEFLVSIMQTIENISNKIHVLSINASVIAARAGEAGKSFMVVAKEVRNLSDNVKQSVDEMKSNSDKLKTSINDVTANIREIESETKTTYEDMENLLMRFEGLNLSINVIDKKIIANMDIIKNFEYLINENIKNNDEYSGLLDSIDIDGLNDTLKLVEQARAQLPLV